jgi:hypothetical protein
MFRQFGHIFFSRANFSLKNNQKKLFQNNKRTYKKTSKLDNSKSAFHFSCSLGSQTKVYVFSFKCFKQAALLLHDLGTNFGCINYKEPSLSDF